MSLLPYDDRDGFIWMDGELRPWREAKLHVLTHGLHYGGCVFEGERAYNGKIFKMREHHERLLKSAEWLDFTIPYTVEELDKAAMETLAANDITEGYVRPVAWRGSEQFGIAAQECGVHTAIACWPWPKYFAPKGGEDAGLSLKTVEWVRPDPRSVPVQSKAAGIYMIGTMVKHQADRAGYDDALMLDVKGRVAESSGANIFFVKGNDIKTPEPECFLNGITRQTIIELAESMGLKVEVGTIMPDEIGEYDEVFLTGTAAEVAPVGKIDDKSYTIGPVTKKLATAYEELVRR